MKFEKIIRVSCVMGNTERYLGFFIETDSTLYGKIERGWMRWVVTKVHDKESITVWEKS